MESHEDELEEGPLSDLSESNVKSLDKAPSRKNEDLRNNLLIRKMLPLRAGLDHEVEHKQKWIEAYSQHHFRTGSSRAVSNNPSIGNLPLDRISASKDKQKQERRRRRSKSAEKYGEADKYAEAGESIGQKGSFSASTTPEKSPKRKGYGYKMKQRLKYGSPLKSVSLTELDLCPLTIPHTYSNDQERRGSSSSLMSNLLTKSLASQVKTFDQHGPSSTSSTGTVVHMPKDNDNGSHNLLLEQIASGSSSLPPDLQQILINETNKYVRSRQPNVINPRLQDSREEIRGHRETSQSSLGSNQKSDRCSYETVIDLNVVANEPNMGTPSYKTAWSTESHNLHGIERRSVPGKEYDNSDSMNTEEEIELVRNSAYFVRKDAEGKESGGSIGTANQSSALSASKANQEAARDFPRRAVSLPKEANTLPIEPTTNYVKGISNQKGSQNVPFYCHREQQTVNFQSRKQSASRRFRGTSSSVTQSELPPFQPSSAATTSEDERIMGIPLKSKGEINPTRREHMVEGAGGGRVRRTSYPANSSTLESCAPIDRAKSFEYFPGEAFPMQENSSSYEYLPGHMVSDRPATVVSNHPPDNLKQKIGRENVDGAAINNPRTIETSPSQISNGDYSTTSSIQSSSNGDVILEKRRTHNNKIITQNATKGQFKKRIPYNSVYNMATESHSLAIDLNLMSNEMMKKYKHLHNAQLSQTKNFYKKVKRYIEFISTPSKTPSDCSLKQKIADKLLKIMTDEENKISEVRSLSSQFGNLFVENAADVQLSPHQTTSGTLSPDPMITQGTQAPSTSVETDENEVQPHSIESSTRRIEDETNSLEIFNSSNKENKKTKSSNSVEKEFNKHNTETINHDTHTNIASPHYFPSLQNWIGPSKIENSYPNSNDVEIQKLRIEQMKKLRKEIRKLEKLECVRLSIALGGKPEDDAELLRQVREDQSSFDSLVTEDLEKNGEEHINAITEKANLQLRSVSNTSYYGSMRKEIDGKSASGSDTNTVNGKKKSGVSNKNSRKDDASKTSKGEPLIAVNAASASKTNKPSSETINTTKNVDAEVKNNKSKVQKLNHGQFKTSFATTRNINLDKGISGIGLFGGEVLGNGSNTYTKSAKQDCHKNSSTFRSVKVSKSQKTQTQKDFSQNFPTPRSTKESISAEYRSNNKELYLSLPVTIPNTNSPLASYEKPCSDINDKVSKKAAAKVKPKALAYYLPFYNNASPLKVGSRILRKKDTESSFNKENRNILSNYISALNASAIKIDSKKNHKNCMPEKLPIRSIVDPNKTLHEALFEHKPDFIRKSEYRVEILRQIKEERCLFSEMQRKLIENMEKDAPKNQAITKLPVTVAPKPRRLFDYKKMITETRHKYEQLPEVVNARYDAKKRSSYRTNRLMADIYQRKLKDNVLKGKVSMTHKFNVFN